MAAFSWFNFGCRPLHSFSIFFSWRSWAQLIQSRLPCRRWCPLWVWVLALFSASRPLSQCAPPNTTAMTSVNLVMFRIQAVHFRSRRVTPRIAYSIHLCETRNFKKFFVVIAFSSPCSKIVMIWRWISVVQTNSKIPKNCREPDPELSLLLFSSFFCCLCASELPLVFSLSSVPLVSPCLPLLLDGSLQCSYFALFLLDRLVVCRADSGFERWRLPRQTSVKSHGFRTTSKM